MILANYQKYGVADWYDWCCNNWGTKWDACDASVCRNDPNAATISFQTAWAFPTPVIQKLSEMFPELKIEGKYADEDIGSNCGTVCFGRDSKGEQHAELTEYTLSEESIRFACDIWDYDPEEYLQDEEDEE